MSINEDVNSQQGQIFNNIEERLELLELTLIKIKQRLKVLEDLLDVPSESPEDITDLHAASIEVNEVTLSWTASISPNVVGYDVYKDDMFLKHVTTTSVIIPGLLADTDYSFLVKTKDDAGNVSGGVSIKIKTKEEPKERSDISGLSETHTVHSVTLQWTNPLSAEFTHVRIARYGTEIANHITDEMYEDTALSANTTYEYKVIAVYSDNSESKGVVKSVTTDEESPEVPITTYLSFNGVNDFAEAMSPISLAGKTGHVIKATIRIPQKRSGNRGFFGFNNKIANPNNEVFILSESKEGRMAYWNRGFVYGQPLPIDEWINIEWRHENNRVTCIVNGKITGQGNTNAVRTDNTNFWLGKTNLNGEFGEFDIRMLQVERMLSYDFTKMPEDPTIIIDVSGNENHAKLTGGEWVQIEDPVEPPDPTNIDGGNFTDTHFTRSFDGGLFTEPQNGQNIDGGDFDGR